jgi:hypothetical protein
MLTGLFLFVLFSFTSPAFAQLTMTHAGLPVPATGGGPTNAMLVGGDSTSCILAGGDSTTCIGD